MIILPRVVTRVVSDGLVSTGVAATVARDGTSPTAPYEGTAVAAGVPPTGAMVEAMPGAVDGPGATVDELMTFEVAPRPDGP